ncbi:MAG: GNAT family N-acetyltransferase [Ilumatobacter sp.]|uniref:GNAT family N-acetyltransferase n=1 Tax=Ilumatobacter sp. TaxID=1967498 RepID=UPI0039192AFE
MEAPFAITPTLTGTQVALVPLGPEHVDGVMELNADAEVGRLTGTHASFERAAIEAWCSSRDAATDRLDFAVLELVGTSAEFVGDLAVVDLDVDNESCAFRIALLAAASGPRRCC